jgi:DNA-binding XRE family transcriptional regulator
VVPVALNPNNLGEQLAKLRNDAGYTQVELALKLRVSQQTISAVEKRGSPSNDLFFRWVAMCRGQLLLQAAEQTPAHGGPDGD